MPPDSPKRYRFGLFELDVEAAELRRSGRRLQLQDLPLRLLHELVARPGQLLTREELRQALWPPDVHVDFDGSLNAAVRRVREALGDSARNPRFVETVPKRGYRFLAPVTIDEPAAGKVGEAAEDEGALSEAAATGGAGRRPSGGRSGRLWPLFVVAAALLVWIFTARFAPKPQGAEELSGELSGELADEPRRLAVLPLEAIGPDERLGPIAAGLTDELIVHVGGLAPEQLVVVAPASVRQAQADGGDLASMARRLDAPFVLAGTLRLEDDRLRVAARLVRASTETLMWTTSLEGRLGSLLDVERQLAVRLGDGLRRELLAGVSSTSEQARTGLEPPAVERVGSRAYEHFLRARYFLTLQTPESFESAERELTSALELEPDFADAWAALAMTRAMIGIHDLERPRDVFPRAETALERALALAPSSDDPASDDALVASAVIDAAFHWNYRNADASLRRVLERSPQHVEARRWLGLLLQAQGRSEEAQAELAVARRLDPLSLTLLSTIGWCHFLAGDFESAIAEAKGVIELDGDYLVAWDDLKWAYTVAGRDEEAAQAFFRVVALEGDADAVPHLRQLNAEEGFRGLLEVSLEHLLRKAKEPGYRSPYDIAITVAALARTDASRIGSALDWLERSFEEREVDMLGLPSDPRLEALREDPRFETLLRRFQAARAAEDAGAS